MLSELQYKTWIDGNGYIEYVGNLYEYAGAFMNDIILADVNTGEGPLLKPECIKRSADYVTIYDISNGRNDHEI